ncbi:MAG: acyltransferase [Clostridiales bacterium]|nr:acyltransferase [Clostridiales bacterium]
MLAKITAWLKGQVCPSRDKGRNGSVDGLRFLFSVAIVYFHILHSNIISYSGGQQLYLTLQEMSDSAGLIVEAFLILGGYFLYHSYQSGKSMEQFAVNRVVRLWPVLAFYTIIMLAFFGLDAYTAVFDLLFLRATGISLDSHGIIWYIGPFFWCSLLLYALLRLVQPRWHGLMLAILTYVGYVMNVNLYSGGLGRDVAYGFVSMAMLRVLAGLSLGCLLAMLLRHQQAKMTASVQDFRWRAVQSVVEIGLSVFLVAYLLLGLPQSQNQLIVVIAFFLLLYCVCGEGNGLVSILLGNPLLAKLGKYSYSIYVMQQISFYILMRALWLQSDFVYDHTYWCIAASVLFSVLVGVLTYHLVEGPVVKWWYQKHRKNA